MTSPFATSRPKNRSESGQAGFTLVEILVALTILAIMGSLTTAFLGQLRKVSEMQARQALQVELDGAARYLERSLETALALPVDMTQARNRSFLSGTPTDISFVSAARLGVSPASLRTKTVHLEDRSEIDGNSIIISIKPRRFGGSAASPIRVTLLKGIENVGFAYLDGMAPKARQWVDRWDRERQLPIAIRFTITREANGRIYEANGIARLAMARQPL